MSNADTSCSRVGIPLRAVAATAALCLVSACRHDQGRPPGDTLDSTPRVEQMSHGEIKLTFTIDPPRIQLDRDVSLTLEVAFPDGLDILLPELGDRLQGFILAESYEDEPVTRDGLALRRVHALMTPLLADEYRLAPMPVSYGPPGDSTGDRKWFPTHPILFEVLPPLSGSVPDDIAVTLKPRWIYPTFRTVAIWTGLVLLGLAALFLLVKMAGRIRHEVVLRRMSPRERALRELRVLLGKHLVEKEELKDFYVELTMIVRRYIERQHTIRAPEQTTEEFLEAVAQDSRFDSETVQKLRSFLQAADLVKFAAYHPEENAVEDATGTAREYIENDATRTAVGGEGVQS